MLINEALSMIGKPDITASNRAKARLDNLTKPIGSLGILEDIIQRLSGIFGDADFDISRRVVIIMCADNGVIEEGVSSCPKEVTATVTKNFFKGITGINVFADLTGADLHVVDVGIDADLSDVSGLVHKKIRKGTSNIAKGSAMTRQEATTAVEIGIQTVFELKEKGYKLFGTGEMGIGNTTTSSAIAAVLTGKSTEDVVGRGAGLTKEAYFNKIKIVENAIDINKPDPNDVLDVLAKVGGFDIASLTGCFIGAAAARVPIIIDGFISSVAALCAIRLAPQVREYIFASHLSGESGADFLLKEIGYDAMLRLGMRLGEGTGAALAFGLLDAAVLAYTRMGTFQDACIEKYVPLE